MSLGSGWPSAGGTKLRCERAQTSFFSRSAELPDNFFTANWLLARHLFTYRCGLELQVTGSSCGRDAGLSLAFQAINIALKLLYCLLDRSDQCIRGIFARTSNRRVPRC